MTDFWESRDVLRHVRDFARGRRACPWSTLGAVLVRVSCHIPPHVYLPPTVGGRVATNLFVALVGPSGVGKGASESAGRDAITFTGKALETLPELPLGSGEGIARTFCDDNQHTALFTAPEVDSLSALFARQGSTLEGELRKLWTGETLGFTNAAKATRTRVERLTYRAGVVVGVQPLRARVLLGGADGGTPQRFVWLPVLDPQRPEKRPDTPDPIEVQIPEFPVGDLDIPCIAIEAIDQHQAAIHRQDPDVNPLDGHALLCRLKVAAALMVLDSRTRIDDEDWNVAGNIMAVSNGTRANVQSATRQRDRSINQAKAVAAAEREEVISDRRHQRARDAILRKLADGMQQTPNAIRMTMKVDIRDHLHAALAELVDEDKIVISAGTVKGREVQMYRRYIGEKRASTGDDDSCTEGAYVPPDLRLVNEPHAHRAGKDQGNRAIPQQTSGGASA